MVDNSYSPFNAEKRAILSGCGQYRYSLTRKWLSGKGTCVFIMLNPSTADGLVDDPTIRRCIGFAKKWGYKQLKVLNLFAFRATSPKDLKRAARPIGPENRSYINVTCDSAKKDGGVIVCAWGKGGEFLDQGSLLWTDLVGRYDLRCLKILKCGQPGHPLYLSKGSKLIKYEAKY